MPLRLLRKHSAPHIVRGWIIACLIGLLGLVTPASVAAQSAPALPPIHPKARQPYVAILMWHDVVPGKKQVWFDTTVQELTAQFQEFQRRKFHIVDLPTLYLHLAEGTPLPPRSLVLTFDDNNRGLYDYAFPLLKRFHYPATLFVHTDYVGVRTVKEHNTWAQLREMQASGLVTIGSLTRSHPADLRKLPDATVQREFSGSKAKLEKQLGHTVFACAYPEGHYDTRVARIAYACGYKMGVMEDWGNAGASQSLMLVHRYSTHVRYRQALNDVARTWRATQKH